MTNDEFKKTGGSAYPHVSSHGTDGVPTVIANGVTVRDYFASKAMHGMISTMRNVNADPLYDIIARDAYRMADAMLKTRIG